jgi:hypothetical protein
MIGFIDTSVTIITNYNSSQSTTAEDLLHSFSSALTDLVLIYESLNDESRMKTHL